MSDYTIKYNDVEFTVDPQIFSQMSETFKTYYDPNKTMTITGERSVELFQKLLPYVQGQNPDITVENVDELESFADEWDVQYLKDSIEKWKEVHVIDVKLDEFLENIRARLSVTSLIPYMVDNINELLSKPKFLNVPFKLLNQILSTATKQEKIKNHHDLYNFIMNFINQDQQNRLNLLNFINPNFLTPNEVEQFFELNFLPEDPYLLSQIPIFLTNLALLFKEKYKNEQVKISSIEIDIQKQDSILEKKNNEYQILTNQLNDLQQQQQQQQRQLSKKPKKPKPKSQMVYKPDSDPDRQPNNLKKVADNRFSYTPSNDTDSATTTDSPTQSSSSFNNHQNRGGSRGGRGRGGRSERPTSPAQPSGISSNSNVGVVTMSNEVPPTFQMQMAMQMQIPMQPPMNMQIQNPMNTPLMSDAQIKELENLQNQYQQQMKQLVQQTPLSAIQLSEMNNLTLKCQQIQVQLEQQKLRKEKLKSNCSISIQKNTKNTQFSVQVPYQSSNQASPLGAPLNPTTSNQTSSSSSAPIQVEKLVPNISVEKPRIKRAALGPEQQALLAAAKKQASVKIEKPLRGASIEFGKNNDDQT